ncbi:hypothetical protein WA158_005127 [Blastocystis sp. Blastoise]
MYVDVYNYSIRKQKLIKTRIPADSIFLPYFDRVYNKYKNKKYNIIEDEEGVTAIISDGVPYKVNLLKMTCECKEFQNKSTPCKHAIVFLEYLKTNSKLNIHVLGPLLKNCSNNDYIDNCILLENSNCTILKPLYALQSKGKPITIRRKRKAEQVMEKKYKKVPYVKRPMPLEDQVKLSQFK